MHFGHLVYAKKRLVMRLALANEVEVLGNMLDRLSEKTAGIAISPLKLSPGQCARPLPASRFIELISRPATGERRRSASDRAGDCRRQAP